MAKASDGWPIDLQRGERVDVGGVKLVVESCGSRGVRLRAIAPSGIVITGVSELLAGEYSLTFERVSAQN